MSREFRIGMCYTMRALLYVLYWYVRKYRDCDNIETWMRL